MTLNAAGSPVDPFSALSPKKRVFSGIQPSGVPHLGNYLGAVQNWVKLQHTQESLWCLVDLHAITVRQEPALLRKQIRELAASLLASGIDPAAGPLFCQSAVPAHAELAWIFNCIARIGWLNRMTQFKDKAGKDRENASVGLYDYPVLMSADILVYKASLVPVGEDQRQHIELANDIAQKFNHDYGVDFFPEIRAFIPPTAARVMSLRDGTKKMSKSEPSDQSRINLTDTADEIALKIKRAKTDPEPLPSEMSGLEQRPEARNLVGIYAALSGQSSEAVLTVFGNQGFGTFKKDLTALIVEKICPIGDKIRELLQNPQDLDLILARGAAEAAALAEPVLREVKYLIGFTGSDITAGR